MSDKTKYGRVVVVGRPNTGKSTLINALVGQKVAITSPMPQTTRRSVAVVWEFEGAKILLTDTPGIVAKFKGTLDRRANKETEKVSNQAEVMMMVIDLSRPKSDEENRVIGIVREFSGPKILVVNKIDKLNPRVDYWPDYEYLAEEFDTTIKISALKEQGLADLREAVYGLLPDKTNREMAKAIDDLLKRSGPGHISIDSKQFLAELIREKAYLYLRREIPYSVAVEVEKIEDKKEMLVVKAVIFTNEERYKKMIIGKGGAKIKEIGFNSRKEMELMAGRKVYLELRVEVDRHWSERL